MFLSEQYILFFLRVLKQELLKANVQHFDKVNVAGFQIFLVAAGRTWIF